MNPTSKVNALLTALDALRADVEELDRAYEREREHTRDLESRLADLTDDFHRVMDEDCESDLEKHCARVPHLRRRIKELEAERDSWREQALDAQQVAIDTEVRLGLRVEQLERALRVENGDPLAGPDGWVPTTRGWRRADMLVTRRWMFGTCARVAVDEDGHVIDGSATDHPNAWDAMTRFGEEE